jgi:site-specific recombinase XerD
MGFVSFRNEPMSLEPITPERALDLYLDHRRNEVARQTLLSHKSRLGHLVDWCNDNGIDNMNDITGRDLYEYRIWRRNDGDLTKASEKTQMVTIRVFVKWLESIEGVDQDLHTKVQLPSLSKNDDVRDEMLSQEEAEEILDYLRKYHYASMEHVIVALVWRTAMRRGSVHTLDVDDYHPEDQYIEVIHRGETGTPLKNQGEGERYIALQDWMCQLLDDWIADKRPEGLDENGREPLVASEQGRVHPSTITRTLYRQTRPCMYADSCPHNRDIDTCEATSHHAASKCPSSTSPHAARRGAITSWLKNGVPSKVVSDRANVGPDVLEKHYDQRDERDKMEQRRDHIDDF